MDNYTKIKQHLQSISGGKNLPVVATVKSVEEQSITVDLASGLKLSDVRLKASINDSDDFLIVTPMIGSKVILLSLTGELDNLVAVVVDSVQKIHYSQSGLEVLYDSEDGKVMIKNESASLHDMFVDLVDIIKNIKVSTPSGLSTVPIADTIASLEQFKTNFKTLLK